MGAQMPQWTPIGDKPGFKYSRIMKPIEPFREPDQHRHRHVAERRERPRLQQRHVAQRHQACARHRDPRRHHHRSDDRRRRSARTPPIPSLEIATEDHSSELGSCGGDYACAYMNTISWRTPTTPNPMELNPRVLFERMFGGDGATAEQRVARLRDNLSILDGVTASVKDLSKGMDAKDKARVTDYLDNVREIERRIAKAEKQNSESTGYGAPERSGRHPGFLRRSRQPVVRPVGHRLPGQHHPRRHLHAGARAQHPHLSADRRARRPPSGVASPERSAAAWKCRPRSTPITWRCSPTSWTS